MIERTSITMTLTPLEVEYDAHVVSLVPDVELVSVTRHRQKILHLGDVVGHCPHAVGGNAPALVRPDRQLHTDRVVIEQGVTLYVHDHHVPDVSVRLFVLDGSLENLICCFHLIHLLD